MLDAADAVIDALIKNPDAWIRCEDESGEIWEMRYVYYNNKLHVSNGTRNEYRITWMTEFLRLNSAKAGDSVVFEATREQDEFRIMLEKRKRVTSDDSPQLIKLTGWRREH